MNGYMLLKKFLTLISILGIILATAITNTTVTAATITVANAFDSGAGSLRQAIADANPGDTIVFYASLSGATITLASQLSINKDLTIDGSSLSLPVTISGDYSTRVFSIGTGATVTLKRLVISDGYTSGEGGGIVNNGSLTMTNTTISGNYALGDGGGIINHGSLNVTGSTISSNIATSGGGITNHGSLTVTDSSFSSNLTTAGGGIQNKTNATLTVITSNFSENEAEQGGGGIFNEGNTSVTKSTFSDNTAIYGAGILSFLAMTTISESTFSGNKADTGGGVCDISGTLSVTGSSFSGNIASVEGGGIYTFSYSTLNVVNSTFSENFAAKGGGISNDYYSTLNLTKSTLSGNIADEGGGIWNNSSATVANSTFSGNSAVQKGGGIMNDYDGILYLKNSTLSANIGPSFGTGIFNEGTLFFSNNIIANSVGEDCNSGYFLTNTQNLVEDGSCEADLSGDPMLGPLADNGGPTQTHALLPGSPAIDAGDAATCIASPVSGKDQRGVKRPQGAGCDIGAFELDTTAPTLTLEQAFDQEDPTSASPINFTATFNEPIDIATFTSSDVTLGGSAGATTAIITESDPLNATAFNIAVSGMTNSGTVIASIGADKVQDIAGNLNLPSTSVDNTVTFEDHTIYLPLMVK